VAKPQGRFSKWFERIALGTIMSIVAFVVERRLLKVIRERGEKGEEPTPVAEGAAGAELTSPSA
jgi:hypothetical protein